MTAPLPAPELTAPALPAPRRRRRWRRWLLILAGAAVAARLLLWAALPFVLPPLLRSSGLQCSWSSLSLSLLGGAVQIDDLDLRAIAAGDDAASAPTLHVGRLAADLDVLELLHGAIVVRSVELASAHAACTRGADGSIVGLGGLLAPAAAAPAPLPDWRYGGPTVAPPAAPPVAARPLSFAPPLRILALRAHDLRVHVVDPALPAPHAFDLVTHVTWTDAGPLDAPGAPGRLFVQLSSPQACDELQLAASVAAGEALLDVRADVQLRGLQPQALAPWLRTLGIAPAAARIDGDFAVSLHGALDAPGPGERTATLVLALQADCRADGAPAAVLDRVEITAAPCTAHGFGHVAVAVHGASLEAARDADGGLRALGLRILPAPAKAPEPPPTAATPGAAPPFTDVALELADVRALWRDASGPLRDLPVRIQRLVVGPLRTASPATPTTLLLDASLPELAGAIALRADAVGAEDDAFVLRGALDAEAITLERLRPLLAAAGMTPTLRDGRLHAQLDARVRADAAGLQADVSVTDLRLADGDAPLVALPRAALRDVRLRDHGRTLTIGELEVEGPVASAALGADGALELPALRLGGALAAPAAVEASAGPPPAAAPLPRIAIEQVRWRGCELAWNDAPRALRQQLQKFELDADHLVLLGGVDADPEGTWSLHAALPELIDGLALAGTLRSRGSSITATATLDADRIALARLRPFLAGLEPVVPAVRLQARARAEIDLAGAGPIAAELTDLALRNGEGELLGLDRAAIANLVRSTDGWSADAVTVDAPRLAVQRTADGALVIAGLRLPPPMLGPPAPRTAPAEPAAAEPAAAGQRPPALRVERFELRGAAVDWHDDLHRIASTLQLDARATGLDNAADGKAAPFELGLRCAEAGSLALHGSLRADPGDVLLTATLEGRALRAGPFAAYLPPTVQALLQDGELDAELELRSGRAREGGLAATAALRALRLRDGERELLAANEVAVQILRLDPAANAFHIGALLCTGVRGELRTGPGAFEVAGVRLLRGPPSPPPPDADPAAVAPATAGGERAADRPPPRWAIDRLDVGLDAFALVDAASTAGPLPITLQVALAEPWASNPDDPPHSPPLRLTIAGKAPPLAAELAAKLDAYPLELEPRLTGSLRLSGLDTTHLLALRPGLGAVLAGGDLAGGELSLRLQAEFHLRRRRSDQFDFGAPFALAAEIDDLALRPAPGESPLLGIDAVELDVPLVDLRRGNVRAQLIAVRTPTLHLERAADGLHVAGLVLRTDAPPAASPVPPAAAPAAAPAPRGEIRIGELSVSGLDFRYVDATASPPLVLPIDNLDFVLERYTTAATRRAEPFRFALTMNGGPLDLPRRSVSSSFVAGILGAAATAVTGGSSAATEPRPLFDELHVDGHLQLYPLVEGEVRANLSAFELLALRGPALGSGVEIGDGLLDSGLRVDLRGSRGTDVQSTQTFTYLSLSEPSGGPVSTFLRLPVPIDTVLFVLRDDQDQQRVALSLHFDQGGANRDSVTSAAIGALGKVITQAIERAPLRVAGAFTGIFGFGGGAEQLAPHTRALTFAAGDATPPADAGAQLGEVIALLRSDPGLHVVLAHALGTADRELTQALASPPPADVLTLAARLRQELAAGAVERRPLVARAHAAFTAGQRQDALAAQSDLLALDRRLGAAAEALDKTLALERPGAARRAPVRSRAFAQDLARERLQRVRAMLLEALGAGADGRIELRQPRPQAGDAAEGTVTAALVRRARG